MLFFNVSVSCNVQSVEEKMMAVPTQIVLLVSEFVCGATNTVYWVRLYGRLRRVHVFKLVYDATG